jgi:hypothetical protein
MTARSGLLAYVGIINSTFVSIDGIVNHMKVWHWAFADEEASEIATGQLLAANALLMGCKTYGGQDL